MTKQDYMEMSGIVYHCDDCKHNDKKWYELPCDYCCPAHSGYEHRQENEGKYQVKQMSRYIGADAVMKLIEEDIPITDNPVEVVANILAELEQMPTADVVEVVRCKDCKYRSKEWYRDKRYKDGGYWIVGCGNDEIAERVYGLAQDNDFCSYGERADT